MSPEGSRKSEESRRGRKAEQVESKEIRETVHTGSGMSRLQSEGGPGSPVDTQVFLNSVKMCENDY